MAGGRRCFDLWSHWETDTNGTDLKVYDTVDFCHQQNFRIRVMGDESVEIGSVNSYGNKVLEVVTSSYNDCEIVQNWERNDSRDNDNWYLEPANVFYCANAILSNTDDGAAQSTVDHFLDLGYLVSRQVRPTTNEIKDLARSAEVLIFHGHGYNGGFWINGGNKKDETSDINFSST